MKDFIGFLEFICPRCQRENHRTKFVSTDSCDSAQQELSNGAKCHFCLFRLGAETSVKVEVVPAYAEAA